MIESLGKIIARRKIIWSKNKLESNQKIFKEWERIMLDEFGPEMLTLAKPNFIKNKKLIITVRNATIACELQARKERIKDQINKKIGDKNGFLNEIVLRV